MTTAVSTVPVDYSLEHVLARLGALEIRVRAAVAARRDTDPNAEDRFRGLYLSHAHVERILDATPESFLGPSGLVGLDEVETEADQWEGNGEVLRLRRLGRVFGLDVLDTELLLVAMAPDLDPRFEQLFGYLHDDVTRRRASIGLALELCQFPTTSHEARHRLSPAGALVAGGLIVLEDKDRPVLSRSLRVPDRVTSHLLGGDRIEPEVAGVQDLSEMFLTAGRHDSLARAFTNGLWPIYLRETGVASGVLTAVSSAAAAGLSTLRLDLRRLAAGAEPRDLALAAIREARLLGSVLVAGPVDALAERSPETISIIADGAAAAVLAGARSWDPAWSTRVPLLVEAPALSADERLGMWREILSGAYPDSANGHLGDLLAAAGVYRMASPLVARAAIASVLRARMEDRPLEASDLQAGARAQNSGGLERLARRVEPNASWDDLILPRDTQAQLRELVARVRHRDAVMGDSGQGGSSTRGRGITALLAGESGTGKTIAAEVIAKDLGLDLYLIDLSTVVDKYIGETEKNLDRIFTEADRVNGVLLFDEADAIFGKRSEVRDARDRYANVEVAYLLQRMERFDGLAILTTNLRANLDDAFTRRIDVIVDFPMPEVDARRHLWAMHLPSRLAHGDDLDLDFMAQRFRLSGGNIRNSCVTAAFLAAEADRPLAMADLIRGTDREYRKLGRLTLESEFGPYLELLTVTSDAG